MMGNKLRFANHGKGKNENAFPKVKIKIYMRFIFLKGDIQLVYLLKEILKLRKKYFLIMESIWQRN